MAMYPGGIKTFDYKHDSTDLVLAADVNVVYDEVNATQTALGTYPWRSGTWGSQAFSTSGSSDWPSVAARIQNIENGVFVAFNNRVNTLGGSTITPSSTSTTGLIFKGINSQTANLLEAQAAGATTAVTKIDKDGILYHNGAIVATLSNAESISNKTITSSTINGASNTLSNIPSSAVIATGTTDIKTYVDAKPTSFYQSTAPTGTIPTGSIWMDSSSSITSFDPTAFLAISAASVAPSTTGFRRVATSTSAPTSGDGANGDIWLQYI